MQLFRFNDGAGYRSALLVAEGPKFTRLVLVDCPVKLVSIPNREARYLKPIDYTGRRRSVVNAFLAAGKVLGITGPAKRALRRAK